MNIGDGALKLGDNLVQLGVSFWHHPLDTLAAIAAPVWDGAKRLWNDPRGAIGGAWQGAKNVFEENLRELRENPSKYLAEFGVNLLMTTAGPASRTALAREAAAKQAAKEMIEKRLERYVQADAVHRRLKKFVEHAKESYAKWKEAGGKTQNGTPVRRPFTEAAGTGSPQEWTADLSHVKGKTAVARNRAIQAVITEDLPNLRLRHIPEYDPFIRTGLAKVGVGTRIGKNTFSSRQELRDTIIHEELHHRWWERGLPSYHHSPNIYVPIERFYQVIERYFRMRGWLIN